MIVITKWYLLSEGGDNIVGDEIRNKVSDAMATINTLKGSGYMPCIPPHILIILQQLEYSMDRSDQERSNYGYLYEFLVNKSILDMTYSCEYVFKDIAFGILTKIAEYMLKNSKTIISLDVYNEIVLEYNELFQTDANAKLYADKYSKVELLNTKNEQISFGYPYIHYYFTAKYLANTISEEWTRKKISDMSQHLYEEEFGDTMIFLCHLSKDDYIISEVLENAHNVLADKKIFDLIDYKSIRLTFDEVLKKDFIPEKDKEKRQEELLELQDMQEREEQKVDRKKRYENLEPAKLEQIYNLNNAFKTIEVMGQILKNYPGTIVATLKNDLLESTYNLGMRTLTYTRNLLYGNIEAIFKEVQKNLQSKPSPIELKKISELSKDVNTSMDNLFAFMTYAMIRKLASSLANKALSPVIMQSPLKTNIAYRLVRDAIQMNEFGTISVDLVINEYDEYKTNKNIFAAKLLRLLVYDHYYVYGSTDFRNRQRIWQKMNFDRKEKKLSLKGRIS